MSANNQDLLRLVGLGQSDDLSQYQEFIGGTELAEALRLKQEAARRAAIESTAETVVAALQEGRTLTEAAIEQVRRARAELTRAEKNLDVMLAAQEAARAQDYFPMLVATYHISLLANKQAYDRYVGWEKEQAPVLAKQAKDRHAAEKKKAASAKKAAPKAAGK